MVSSSYTKARRAEQLAQAHRVLGKLDMTHAALGHISYRLDDGHTMLIKGKGVDEAALRFTEPGDIVEVDFAGETVDGPSGLRAPSEAFIHTQIFKKHPEVQSVVHCHPEHAILVSICELKIMPIYGMARPSADLAIRGIPIFRKSLRVLSAEMGDELADFMGNNKVVLMKGHGISVYGSSIEDATVRALEMNELLTMTYKAYLVGQPIPISDEDIEELRRPLAHVGRGSAGGEAQLFAHWRNYLGLAGETNGRV
jgi:ribulose-5-phosphate 4-epimerase/fuculose-1-phosphate aldolase